MDTLIAVLNGILTVMLLIALNGVSYVKSMQNFTGQKKSVLKTALWAVLGLIHSYALLDLVASWVGSDFTRAGGAPPSVAPVYQGFVSGCMTFIVELFRWIASLA